MSINFILNGTNNKLKLRETWPAQKNDFNIVDISLCAGQTIIPGKDDDIFGQFIKQLDDFKFQLLSLFPFITFTEKNILHSTLLTIFNNHEDEFTKNKGELLNLCAEIRNDFYNNSPLTIIFKNVVLTSNGSIIILGESNQLSDFREFVYNKYDIDKSLKKNIIHITLGRLLQDESFYNMNDINTFLQMKGDLSLPPVIVNHPKFILSRDLHCSIVDKDLSMDFTFQK
ncbi:hypothetical protein RIY08_004223 [Salmonella enterica]|nr:hypothetical protein [Salmonella enterica]